MDLSKAFDRMPHGLLIAKLDAYGLSINACQLIISYLKDRRQRVKVMYECSDWTTVIRGVPKGSVRGPLSINIFLNGVFYVKMNCAPRFVFKDNKSSYVDLSKQGNFSFLSAYRIRNLVMGVFKCF